MELVLVQVIAMGWVDLARGTYFHWWLGDPPVPGVRPDFQVAECQVAGEPVVLAWAWPPAPPEAEAAALRVLEAHFGADASLALMAAEREGGSRVTWSRLSTRPGARVRVALAEAVVRSSWGWDESPEIQVLDSVGTISVRTERRDDGWYASVTHVQQEPPGAQTFPPGWLTC